MKDATRVDAQEAAQAVLTGTQALKAEADELLEFISSGNTEKFFQEVARRTRETMQRHYREHWAPDIANRAASYWQFPYTAASRTLLAYDEHRFGNISDAEAVEALEPRTWSAFKTAHDRVLTHFGKVLDAIEGGTFTDDSGARPLRVDFGTDKDGQTVAIDIAPAIRALAERGYNSLEIFGNFDPPLCSITYVGEEGLIYDEPADDWASGDFAIERNGRGIYSLVVPDYDEGGVSYSFEYDPREEWGFAYLLLCALVADLDCAKSVRACAYPQKRPRKTRNLMADTVRMPNDAVHKALLDKPETEITASQYWGDGIQIATGRSSFAKVTITNDFEFDEAMEAYKLGPIDRFWYEALCSLAYEGYSTIRGSDLLKFNGYKNPYQQTARKVMVQALNSIMKMTRVRVVIDATNELKAYPNLAQSYGFKPVIDGTVYVMRFTDDTCDFEIRLHTDNDGTPFGALSIAAYARDKKQLVAAKREDMEFKTVGSLRDDQRRMWRYVMRRAREHKTSNTILFDTIFRNIGLEDMTRNKRYKMLRTLRAMLEEKQSDGVLEFAWIREHDRDVKVIVTLADSGE